MDKVTKWVLKDFNDLEGPDLGLELFNITTGREIKTVRGHYLDGHYILTAEGHPMQFLGVSHSRDEAIRRMYDYLKPTADGLTARGDCDVEDRVKGLLANLSL